MSTIEERVARGAALLDRHEPDWPGRIDVDRLDLARGQDCVWGQLIGGYWHRPTWALDGEGLGFCADMSLPADEWFAALDGLKAEWHRVITERRAAA